MGSIAGAIGSNVAVTITLAALASSATVGRQSTELDFSAGTVLDIVVSGWLTTHTTAPTANTTIQIWWIEKGPDGTYPAGLGLTDAGFTLFSVDQLSSYGTCLASMIVTAATAQAYYFRRSVMAATRALRCAPKGLIFVLNSTGQQLHGTAGNHVINAAPTYLVTA
jgi:hypothetical protein